MAVALEGDDTGLQEHVRFGHEHDGRAAGFHVHAELRGVLRLDRTAVPRPVREDTTERERGPLGGDRRDVGGTRLQPAFGRIVGASAHVFQEVLPERT